MRICYSFEYTAVLHVETGQIPEERVSVIKVTTQQGISHQDSSPISQILSNQPEITNLNQACLSNTADMISKGDINIFTTTAGHMKLPNIKTGRSGSNSMS